MTAFKEIANIITKETGGLKKHYTKFSQVNDNLETLIENLSKLDEIYKNLMEIRQENVELRKNIRDWAESSIAIFESLERNINFTDIDENYQKAANTFLKDFDVSSLDLGLERINPEKGVPFNEKMYAEVGKESSSDVKEGNIVRCKKWGYKLDSKVLKKAEVVVANYSRTVNEENVINPSSNLLLPIEEDLKSHSLQGDGD